MGLNDNRPVEGFGNQFMDFSIYPWGDDCPYDEAFGPKGRTNVAIDRSFTPIDEFVGPDDIRIAILLGEEERYERELDNTAFQGYGTSNRADTEEALDKRDLSLPGYSVDMIEDWLMSRYPQYMGPTTHELEQCLNTAQSGNGQQPEVVIRPSRSWYRGHGHKSCRNGGRKTKPWWDTMAKIGRGYKAYLFDHHMRVEKD